jgi:hypothetical protein
MGGIHRRDTDTVHNTLKMCVSLRILPHSFLISMAGQTAQASFTRHHSRQHSMSCANTRSMSYSYPQLLPPTARSTVPRHQCITHLHFPKSRTHSTMTTSLYGGLGQLGKNCGIAQGASTRKRGVKHGSTICLLTPESTWRATTAREKCTRPSCKTKAPKYVLTYLPTYISSRVRLAADPTPAPQRPDTRTSFLREELLYDENARRADCDPCSIFRTPTAAPAVGLVRPLRSSSFSVQTVERALAEMKGSSDATLGGLGRRAAAPTSPIPGSVASPCSMRCCRIS